MIFPQVTALMEAAIGAPPPLSSPNSPGKTRLGEMTGGHAAVAKKLLDVASRTCAWNPIVLKRLRVMERSRLSDFLR